MIVKQNFKHFYTKKLGEGLRIIGSSTAELTLVDYPTAERRTTHNMCGAMDDRGLPPKK